MLQVGDKAIHMPSRRTVRITSVGAVTYGVTYIDSQTWNTVPHEDVRSSCKDDRPLNENISFDSLSFRELREASDARHMENAGGESDWTLADWGNALAGETGELCNFIKKSRRSLPTDPSLEELKQDMAYELADIVTYADLIASEIGIDLGQAVRDKFNIVSKRRNSSIRL